MNASFPYRQCLQAVEEADASLKEASHILSSGVAASLILASWHVDSLAMLNSVKGPMEDGWAE